MINGRFQLERLGEVSVKGKAHAIVTFRVTSSEQYAELMPATIAQQQKMTRSSLGRTWHIVTFVFTVVALVLQLILILLGQNILDSSSVTSGLPEQVRRYFSYFTIQSNLLVAISMFMLSRTTGTQLFGVLVGALTGMSRC